MKTNQLTHHLNNCIFIKNDVHERLFYYMDRLRIAENENFDEDEFWFSTLEAWHRLLQVIRR